MSRDCVQSRNIPLMLSVVSREDGEERMGTAHHVSYIMDGKCVAVLRDPLQYLKRDHPDSLSLLPPLFSGRPESHGGKVECLRE